MKKNNILNLHHVADSRGMLCVLQDEIPFAIERVFWILDADEQIRGGHRHVLTRQALIALKGRVDVYMNDGINEQKIELDSTYKCLIVEPEDWHTMYFHAGSILLVLASEKYDRKDYITEKY